MDVILLPLHVTGVHWSLIALDLGARAAHLFDSLLDDEDDDGARAAGDALLRNALRWLAHESVPRGQAIDTATWRTLVHGASAVPQQSNTNDCGVFLLSFARCITTGCAWDFSAADIPFLRRRIALDLLQVE